MKTLKMNSWFRNATCAAIAGLTALGCEDSSLQNEGSIENAQLDSITVESEDSIFVPYSTLPRLMDASSFDGESDAQLQGLMSLLRSKKWTPVEDGKLSESQLQKVAEATENVRNMGDALRFIGVVTDNGHYIAEVSDQEIEALSQLMGDQVAEMGEAAPMGWSDGVDNRVQRTGTNIPIQQGLVAGVGQCSGALIGRRIVRTAAHCVIAHNSSGGTPVASATYFARRDEGSWYLSGTTSFYFYGGAYIPRGCGTSVGNDYWNGYNADIVGCSWADWAYLILPSNWHGSSYIAWYGYQGLTSSDVGLNLESGGYPGCDDTSTSEGTLIEDPAGCWDDNQGYYRDRSSHCEVGSFTAGTAMFMSGCDVSPGNSGGPVVKRDTGYLIGHAQWQACSTCSAADDYPNHYLGHDTWLFNFQQDLRADYP